MKSFQYFTLFSALMNATTLVTSTAEGDQDAVEGRLRGANQMVRKEMISILKYTMEILSIYFSDN